MDYSKLSDFEINCEVFEKLYGGAPDYKEGENGAMVLISYEGDIVRGEPVEIAVERGKFSPCNNPADAWPIILKNNITIINDKNCYPRATNDSHAFIHEQFNDCIHALDRNPLRAAMIVYLMM